MPAEQSIAQFSDFRDFDPGVRGSAGRDMSAWLVTKPLEPWRTSFLLAELMLEF
jgi:hypothetical protein